MEYNKTYVGVLSIGYANADQEEDFSPSDFFNEEEWNAMDPDDRENKFCDKCYDVMIANFADFGIRDAEDE